MKGSPVHMFKSQILEILKQADVLVGSMQNITKRKLANCCP